MNCLGSIVKYILYLVNIIFLALGVLLIVVGSIMVSEARDVTSFKDALNTATIPIMVIILGCIIFIISFFGCCGAIKENSCCTSTYGFFMFILFCLQVALVVWMFVKHDDFMKTMNDVIKEAWDKNDQSNGYPMDTFQMSFKCCGLDSYKDYGNNPVRSSCCGSLTKDCPASTYESRPGCQQEFMNFWTKNINIVRYTGIVVALAELVAMTFACFLTSNIKKSHRSF